MFIKNKDGEFENIEPSKSSVNEDSSDKLEDDYVPGDSSLEDSESYDEEVIVTDDDEEISEAEKKRRSFQSRASKLEQELTEEKKRSSMLEEVLLRTAKSQPIVPVQKEVELRRPESPIEFMPKDELYDTNEAWIDPHSLSFKARVAYDRAVEDYGDRKIANAVKKENIALQNQRRYEDDKNAVISDKSLGIDAHLFESEFKPFLSNPSSLTMKDAALLFQIKRGKFNSAEIIERFNRGAPDSPAVSEKNLQGKKRTLNDDYRAEYGF